MLEPARREKIRKIAIIVDRLERDAADQLLDGFSADEQREIRDAMMELSEVPHDEAEQVSRGFYLRLKGTAFPEAPTASTQCSIPTDAPSASDELAESLGKTLAEVPTATLRLLLERERPQVLALVATSLSSHRAAEFVGALPFTLQTEVLEKIASLHSADEFAIAELREELKDRLATIPQGTSASNSGVARLRSIVSAADRSMRHSLVERLTGTQPELASQLAHRRQSVALVAGPHSSDPNEIALAFDRFVDLDERLLRDVFQGLGVEVASLALRGASQPCLTDILRRLPASLSHDIHISLQQLGPVRLSDIHQAQAAAVAAGRQLLATAPLDREAGKLKLSA